MKVSKAIIPAAGLGTRFLPATKAQPKEMLPIVDKPTIQYIVEEAISSGIEDIIIVTGRGKRAIEDHFDKSYELEAILEASNKLEELKDMERISNMVNIHYIRQKQPRGLGHAVWCARKFIGNQPFAVLLGDDIVTSEIPCLSQLMDIFHEFESNVIGVQKVPLSDVGRYGIVGGEPVASNSRVFRVQDMVEKPAVHDAPSQLAIMGRYILRPEIFDILEYQAPGVNGEIQLTDALVQLAEQQSIMAYEFEGNRYDVGSKLGFIKATIDISLSRNDLKKDVIGFLLDRAEKLTIPHS
ncbi:UTP--glucose-1-phosphate uridylyltransferase GalU [Brevibacillus fluminis]|uniref:UTP--glucose-1-phosphate uridylyltransferase GalU n=1 Tax=Brevibacillus fluminis TaxID=511487 RepID=UPI003F8BF18A